MILYVNFYNILFTNNMIKISNIYVSNTEYLIQQINMFWCRKNRQHYMLAHPDSNNISIDSYEWERLPTTMLADFVYVTRLLNLIYVEVIANFQCYLYI